MTNQDPIWENNQVPAALGVEKTPLENNTVTVNYRNGLLCAGRDCITQQTDKINTFSTGKRFREFVGLGEKSGTFSGGRLRGAQRRVSPHDVRPRWNI